MAHSSLPQSSPKAEKDAIAQLFATGRYVDAERLARDMTVTYPNDAFGWKALGATLQQIGRTLDALKPMQRAAGLAPRDAEAHSNLGTAFAALKRFEEAVAAYRQAVAIDSTNSDTYQRLGTALRKLGRLEEGEAAYRTAIELAPEQPEAYCDLGNALNELGRLDEAETAYRRSIALRPGYPTAYNNLGNVLLALGRIEDAKSAYRVALASDPNLAQSSNSLGALVEYAEDDARIPAMEQLYRERQLPESDHVQICFSLGKAYEDLGRVDDAFACYAEGNRLRKKSLGYSVEGDRALFETMHSLFSNAPTRNAVGASNANTPRPIFIVGMPRSGTSLAEQILASHSQVFGAGELMAMKNAVLAQFRQDGMKFRFTLSETALEGLRSHYLMALRALDTEAAIITDKMPANFPWIGFILEAMPEARIVNLVRDPIAVCWSNYKHHFFHDGVAFAYDFNDLADYFRMYKELMEFWHQRYPGQIHDLCYERLTENQEEETRALLDYCGLDWEKRCLEFHKTERVVRTASAAQVRKRLYTGSSEAWRKFEKHLAPLVERLKR